MAAGWAPDDAGNALRRHAVGISFQRCEIPAAAAVGVPHSLGALPLGRADDNRLLLPVSGEEAFWMGVSSARGGLKLLRIAGQSGGRELVLLSMEDVTDPFWQVVGMRGGAGSAALLSRIPAQGATAVESIAFLVREDREVESAAARVDLVDHARFSRETSRRPPPPIDREAAFKGYRLP